MLKKLFYITILISFSALSLSASVYKGHVLFKKKCLSCHGKALEFVISKDTAGWSEIMKDDGSALLLIHVRAPKAEKSLTYFKGKRYQKNVRHFRDFFLEYASDTGNIPACD